MEENIDSATVIVLPNGKTFPRKVYSAYTADELKEVIGCCYSIKHIVETLRINRFYHRYIKEFIKEHEVSIVHFKPIKREPIENLLVKGSTAVCSKNIKKHLVEKKLVKNECAVCKIPPLWNNKPLTLQLDHINGNHYDNRVENLRLICPNCHTQTDTYTGKNVAKYEKKKCSVCNEKELKNNNISGKCAKCINAELEEGICAECNVNYRFGDYLKCKECLKKAPPPKLCKKCEKPITRSYNNGDYHMRCHKGIEKQKPEEL
jgi:hypothetical protein